MFENYSLNLQTERELALRDFLVEYKAFIDEIMKHKNLFKQINNILELNPNIDIYELEEKFKATNNVFSHIEEFKDELDLVKSNNSIECLKNALETLEDNLITLELNYIEKLSRATEEFIETLKCGKYLKKGNDYIVIWFKRNSTIDGKKDNQKALRLAIENLKNTGF